MRSSNQLAASTLSKYVGPLIAVLAIVGVSLTVAMMQRLPSGPEPIAWDKEACAYCRMHVGDPRFAAQLQTSDGQVRNYDDPGCLLSDLAARRPPVHAIYFHDSAKEGWLKPEEVAFVSAATTPMGYGLAAVPRGTPGSLAMEAAAERVLHDREKSAEHREEQAR